MFFRPRTTRIPFRANEQKRKVGRRLQRIELDLTSDRHARAAIEAYADSCAVDMPWLAELLRESAANGTGDLSDCAATVRRVFGLAQDWAAGQPDYARSAWEHVRIHLEAALNRQLKPQEDEENEDGEHEAQRLAPIRTG
jgi:hypothetical protein